MLGAHQIAGLTSLAATGGINSLQAPIALGGARVLGQLGQVPQAQVGVLQSQLAASAGGGTQNALQTLQNQLLANLRPQIAENQLAQNQLIQNQLAQNQVAQNQLTQNQVAQHQLTQNQLAQHQLNNPNNPLILSQGQLSANSANVQSALGSTNPQLTAAATSLASAYGLGGLAAAGDMLQQQVGAPGGQSYTTPGQSAYTGKITSSTVRKEGQGPEGANLFIYQVPPEFNDQDLVSYFQPYGTIVSAKIFVDKATGASKGFGFVSYDNPSSANAAIAAMNGVQIGSRRLRVQLKRPKEQGRPY